MCCGRPLGEHKELTMSVVEANKPAKSGGVDVGDDVGKTKKVPISADHHGFSYVSRT